MLELDERNYALRAGRGTVLIGLWADGAEKPMAEGFPLLAAKERAGFRCCKLDLSAQPGLARRLDCHRGCPSLLLLQDGQVVQRFRGNYGIDALEQILRSR